MKTILLSILGLFITLTLCQAQVGIGTTTPQAYFNVVQGRTVLFGQDSNQVGSVNKLIWYASQGAFRVGGVTNTYWSRSSATDNTNIGQYSFASGYNTRATGSSSVALGSGSVATGSGTFASGELATASGHTATAMGYQTTAGGNYATAMGYQTTANGYYATALGNTTTASGLIATAMGLATTASGEKSTAMGFRTTASGEESTAMGYQTTASGDLSTAMGVATTASGYATTAMGYNVSTNGQEGSFILGDVNSNTYLSSAKNQMTVRFGGGYVFYTSSTATPQSTAVGVRLLPGGNAWQTLSDSTRKENFRNVDGVSFLQKIANMRLGSWNYKGQDVTLYRHYGPMAQEFFSAFGHDELGVIGEDKSINQADFDGVSLIAIQALIKEINQLKEDNNQFRQENAALKTQMQTRLEKIEALLQRQTTNQAFSLQP